jgi:hypothetical protein
MEWYWLSSCSVWAEDTGTPDFAAGFYGQRHCIAGLASKYFFEAV